MEKLFILLQTPELRKKLLIVSGLMIATRFLAAVPVPGIDASQLSQFFSSNQILGFFNLFSGGGLSNL
ncbi:MAG: preprotein translocase subunit SecY, partial [Nanoarchaeota archaeon]